VLLIDRFGRRHLSLDVGARLIPARLLAPRLAAWLLAGTIGPAAAAFGALRVTTHSAVAAITSRRVAPWAIRAPPVGTSVAPAPAAVTA
jgi:hypothetical protein